MGYMFIEDEGVRMPVAFGPWYGMKLKTGIHSQADGKDREERQNTSWFYFRQMPLVHMFVALNGTPI
jgi:hypothetical protein